MYSNNSQRLSMDLPNVGYLLGEKEIVLRWKKMKTF
jgi:hypothetical protein